MKLVANSTLAGIMGLIGEALALADGFDLRQESVVSVLLDSPIGPALSRKLDKSIPTATHQVSSYTSCSRTDPPGASRELTTINQSQLDSPRGGVLEMSPTSTMDIEVPPDLASALEYRKEARATFAQLGAQRKQDIVQWIEGARDDQHRMERVRMVVDVMLPNLDA